MSDFRFLINIDHCILEERYEHFLYSSESLNKLVFLSSSLGDEGLFAQNHSALIKDQLNRNALRVSFYQLIFVMQEEYIHPKKWDDTLLSKLFDIDRGLVGSKIISAQGQNYHCNVSVIIIRRVGGVLDTHINETQYINDRLTEDCRVLCELLGVPADTNITLKDLRAAINKYRKKHSEETKFNLGILFCVENLINSIKTKTEFFRMIDLVRRFTLNYDINELFIQDNARDEMTAIFRAIDYATIPLKNNVQTPTGFRQDCKTRWQSVKQDAHIVERFAEIMFNYDHKLSDFIAYEQKSIALEDNYETIGEYTKPFEDAIREQGVWFEDGSNHSSGFESPNVLIDGFKKDLSPIDTLMVKWALTYDKLCDYTDDLQMQLDRYAEELRVEYVKALRERSRNMRELKNNGPYRIDKKTRDQVKTLMDDRDRVLESIKSTQIIHPMSYSDQAKIASKLSCANNEIIHYISCLQATRNRKAGLFLALLIMIVTLVLYVLLQHTIALPPAANYAFVYLFITLFLVAVFSAAPIVHYKRKIRKRLNLLKEEISKVVKKYEKNAESLQENINLCNYLDDLTQHLRFREQSITASDNRANAKKWYIDRATDHLKKVRFFQDVYSDVSNTKEYNHDNYPIISEDGNVDDVVDCSLFWSIE